MPPPNNLRENGPSRGTNAAKFQWLSPPGASALALLFLQTDRPGPLFGGKLTKLADTPTHLWLVARDGTPIDEAMACRERDGFLLTLHGGAGVRQAIEHELQQRGWKSGSATMSTFGRTPFEKATLSLLTHAHGTAAAKMVMEASKQAAAFSDALASGNAVELLGAAADARFLTNPPRVQLWGPVNAGKSSLLNSLCGRELASVGNEPGLTRDVIEGRLTHEGYVIRVFDAPGVWSGGDLDSRAIELAKQWRSEADLTIELVPPGANPPSEGWWYHSRADESGLNGLSVHDPASLEALKVRFVDHFFGRLRDLNPAHRLALHPAVITDLQDLAAGRTDGKTLRQKWLKAD